jgi:hypothetical protein
MLTNTRDLSVARIVTYKLSGRMFMQKDSTGEEIHVLLFCPKGSLHG